MFKFLHQTISKTPINRKKAKVSPIITEAPSILNRLNKFEPEKYNSLKDLEKFTEDSNICSLKKTAKTMVWGDGDISSPLMLIGEAPGATEEEQKKPFVGMSGRLLTNALIEMGIDRNKIYITNSVFWRPPDNRNPTKEELQSCFPILKRKIELQKPKCILLAGGIAAKSLLNTELGIGQLRNKWHQVFEIPTYCTFHPSYILRSGSQRPLLLEDIGKIVEFLKQNNLFDKVKIS